MPSDPRFDPERVVRAPRGTQLHCRSWQTEGMKDGTDAGSEAAQDCARRHGMKLPMLDQALAAPASY